MKQSKWLNGNLKPVQKKTTLYHAGPDRRQQYLGRNLLKQIDFGVAIQSEAQLIVRVIQEAINGLKKNKTGIEIAI